MSHSDIGDVITVWVAFRDDAGIQTAPTDVELHVRKPDGTTIGALVMAADAADEARAEAATGQTLSGVVGVYFADLDLDQAGTWAYKWIGTGALAEQETGRLDVRRDLVGTPPGTLALTAAATTAAFTGTST